MIGCTEVQLLNLFRLWLEAVWELVMLYLWKLVYEKKGLKNVIKTLIICIKCTDVEETNEAMIQAISKYTTDLK